MKTKIKLTGIDLMSLVEGLEKMEVPSGMFGIPVTSSTVPMIILKELEDLLRKKTPAEITRKVTIKLPDSYCLVFFSIFSGPKSETNYLAVAIKTFCRQIEEQLFRSGRYSAPKTNIDISLLNN